MSITSGKQITSMVEQSGVPVRELADELGISNVTLYKWMRGKVEPKGENLKRLCNHFHVTPAQILFGDGNDPRAQSIKIDINRISIPLLDVEACCGIDNTIPSYVPVIKMVDVDDSFYRQYLTGANKRSLHIVHAIGDSMAPTIYDGQPVIIDTSDNRITRDGIYAFIFNQGLFIKRVQCEPTRVKLLSDNKNYDPIIVEGQESLNIIGRVYCGFKFERY